MDPTDMNNPANPANTNGYAWQAAREEAMSSHTAVPRKDPDSQPMSGGGAACFFLLIVLVIALVAIFSRRL